MKNIFSSGLKKDIETDAVKHFAVIHGGQGRIQVVIENTHEALTELLRQCCPAPTDIEAMGTCNKQGVIDMTNPDKFQKEWLDKAIAARLWTIRDLFRKPPAEPDTQTQDI
jgi:hypothetical protein